MAPIELHSSPSLLPLATSGAHLFLVGYLSVVAARTIYRSYVALPPSSATRNREPLRKGHVKTFALLALISLAVSGFFAVRLSGLSYRVWAAQRGVALPQSVFGDNGALRGGEHPGRLHLARWLNDVPFYQDAFEIVAEKNRNFWWGQQINLGLVSWSVYLAIEGQRRKISNLWAFLALAQLVNLSYAQSLFFVAVLLTPVPLPENVKDLTKVSMPVTSSRYSEFMESVIPTKPEGFLPKPALYTTLLVTNFTSIFLIPFAANTPSFATVSIASRVLPFSFLVLPYVIPTSWGTIHTHPHSAHSTYTTVFRTISFISMGLFLKSTLLAVVSNTPEQYESRHSLLHPFREERLSALDRGSTAIGRLLGAIGEHPAVGAVGWDVILSSLSLVVWAGIRGLSTWDMMGLGMLFAKPTETDVESEKEPSVKEAPEHSVDATPSVRRRPGRPKKEKVDDTDDASSASAPRRRGRSSKKSIADDDNAEYLPADGDSLVEGDEDVEIDLESAATAWGAIITGGLGKGSAGIFEAEVKA
ncbi:hypothetical protein LSUE1_G006397, partial [Lachnellula suecica]